MEKIGFLIIRVIVGLYYSAHGAQKAFGWFGGNGPTKTGAFGIRPGRMMALLIGISEFVGGILFVLGFLTPLSALLIIIPMIGAIKTVHGKNGLFVDKDGIEYNLVLIAVALGITLSGPGLLSLDVFYNINVW
ncbi:DoxX family protein [Lentibacillus cibarius]|uniref:DoxX family protein n=1 Tax=Lentibacillus cibarius TaxID=2583219 RepID=A0A549YBJ0_9BACI|nr:DoxX family protein [Lentibacillus cibarius]TRM09231.1 DoxX family protein [Lentibacillus cibarius]TRM11515.1 DoxX family protein [Lentibacillus cibarius]